MTLICLIIALGLEFYFKLGSEYRHFSWFHAARKYLTNFLSDYDFFESWLGLAIILLTPLLVLYGFLELFGDFWYAVFSFLMSAAVLFLCFGPKPLEDSFDGYFDAMNEEDLNSAFLYVKASKNRCLDKDNSNDTDADADADADTGAGAGAGADADADADATDADVDAGQDENEGELPNLEGETPEKDELVRMATKQILIESHHRYFGVLVWFFFFGLFGALFYRLSYLYRDYCGKEQFDEHLPLVEQLIHWIDWVPVRVTSLMFLLTGDFVKGIGRLKDYLSNTEANNSQLISETGIASLGLEMGVSDGDVKENKRAMDMIDRTLIVFLVFAALMTSIL